MASHVPSQAEVLGLVAEHLDRAFCALLGDRAFADACPVPPEGAWETGPAPFVASVRLEAGERLEFSVGGERACLLDLAAGVYSLPDDHVDDLLLGDFLAETAAALAAEIGQILVEHLDLPSSRLGVPRLIDALASDSDALRREYWINERGRIAIVVRRVDEGTP